MQPEDVEEQERRCSFRGDVLAAGDKVGHLGKMIDHHQYGVEPLGLREVRDEVEQD